MLYLFQIQSIDLGTSVVTMNLGSSLPSSPGKQDGQEGGFTVLAGFGEGVQDEEEGQLLALFPSCWGSELFFGTVYKVSLEVREGGRGARWGFRSLSLRSCFFPFEERP